MGGALTPQQRLYFLPEPQGQGELRPTLGKEAAFRFALC